jgi:glyoxylase-like metal-dependent hydrolase (beta-lactamase superfamily II)
MISVKVFPFNAFQVNTYLIYDETKDCIIVDAANYNELEDETLNNFIISNELKIKYHINTHCHVDHVLGGYFVEKKFNVGLTIHNDSKIFLDKAVDQAKMYGFNLKETAKVDKIVNDEEIINFGNTSLKVIHTPGHADGSICLISFDGKFVITGDVLFRDSIGRTDLPTGNYDILINNIEKKIFTLPDDFTILPGHGPSSKIGYEKKNNPFFN